jgi:hypothetical protein
MRGIRNVEQRARQKAAIADAAHNERDATRKGVADKAAGSIVVQLRDPGRHDPKHSGGEKVGADHPSTLTMSTSAAASERGANATGPFRF